MGAFDHHNQQRMGTFPCMRSDLSRIRARAQQGATRRDQGFPESRAAYAHAVVMLRTSKHAMQHMAGAPAKAGLPPAMSWDRNSEAAAMWDLSPDVVQLLNNHRAPRQTSCIKHAVATAECFHLASKSPSKPTPACMESGGEDSVVRNGFSKQGKPQYWCKAPSDCRNHRQLFCNGLVQPPTYRLSADASSRRTSSNGSHGSGAGSGIGSTRSAQERPAAKRVSRKETATLQVRQRPRLASGLALQWQQLCALTGKNFIIRRRAWKTNLLLIAQAVLFITLIFAVDLSSSRQRQPAFSRVESASTVAIGPVPDCASNLFMRAGQPCITFLYAPAGDPAVEAVVRGVMAANEPPIRPERVLGLANSSEIDAWLLAHPETSLAAVIFSPPEAPAAAAGPGSTAGGSTSSLPASAGSMNGSVIATGWGGNGSAVAASMPAAGVAALPGAVGSDGYGAAAGGPAGVAAVGMRGGVPLGSSAVQRLGFTVQTNSSVQWFKGSYQHPNTWSVGLAQFPHPSAKSPSLIGQFAPTFLFASIMFQFVLLVHDFVAEKEGRARQMMATMGLRSGPFWGSWVLFQGLLAALEACLLVGFGYAFGFRLFTRNAFGLSFLLLLLVSLAMTAFGFFMSAFLKKASAAVPAGFLLFVVAWVILTVIAFGFPYSSSTSLAAVAVFSAMPWSLLSKGVQDLADATAGRGVGIPWADRFAYCQPGRTLPPEVELAGSYWQEDCVMPLGQMYWVLAVQCVGFMWLAVYLDAVLPDANGVCLPPWFFLLPSYWGLGMGRRGQKAAVAALGAPTDAECGLVVDVDVAAEQLRQRQACVSHLRAKGVHVSLLPAEAAALPPSPSFEGGAGGEEQAQEGSAGRKGKPSAAGGGVTAAADGQLEGQSFSVQMWGLRKVYRRGFLPGRRRPFVAVRGNWLGVRHGECFCLLGPNGAGKSTTIGCLTGVLPLDGGEALVCGESIAAAGGMDRVRPLMGVCPQFDVLWEQLTGAEHLLLFAAIKGLPSSVRQGDAARLLEEVKLSEAGGVRAGSYSGGMKRRLSVVYLDEPTTGLDPLSRRHLWDLVDRAKRDRAIVLTTHSMEEADILGDRIGIMARGRLRCIGNSLRLKSRFGSGYRISIRVQGGGGSGGGAWAGAAGGGGGSCPPASTSFARGLLATESGEIQPDRLAHLTAADVMKPASRQVPPAGEVRQRDPAAAAQAAAVRALFLQQLDVKPSDESLDYLHFLVPYEQEAALPALFSHLKANAAALGVADVQLRLTPLEEVFLAVARKAELEHAQLEGRRETLALAEEGVSVSVPLGADFIQSPAGHLYHITWGQDPDTGELKLQDYWRDPVSAAAAAAFPPKGPGADEDSGSESSGDVESA
ncbi:ABC transporter A family member 11 [Chlorella vulgaris]